jgi:outer membrane protein
MVRRERVLGIAGAILLMAGYGGTVLAAEAFKIGVVDQRAVLERTKAGKRAMQGLKEFTDSRQRIISADDQELKSLEDAVKNQEGGLSEAAKREKQELFRTKFESYQRRIQDFNREIQTKQREVGEEFQRKLDEVTASVAEQGGYSLVFEKGHESTIRIVLYNQHVIDLTDQVVKEFDRRNK